MSATGDGFAGRTVYDNIRKFVTYISAHATPEMVPFLLYALSGASIPLPLTALQILAIDLGTETLPALALGREPAEPGLMDQPPRSRKTGILTRATLTRAWLWLGLLEAALVAGGFFFVLLRAGWSPGDPTGAGAPLHHTYMMATTMPGGPKKQTLLCSAIQASWARCRISGFSAPGWAVKSKSSRVLCARDVADRMRWRAPQASRAKTSASSSASRNCS